MPLDPPRVAGREAAGRVRRGVGRSRRVRSRTSCGRSGSGPSRRRGWGARRASSRACAAALHFLKPCADTRSGASPNAHACLATDRTTTGDTRHRTLSGANPNFLRRVYPVPRMSVGRSLGQFAIWQLAAELTPPRRLHAAIRREDRWVLRHRCQAASREEGRLTVPPIRATPGTAAVRKFTQGPVASFAQMVCTHGGRVSPMRQPWKQENARTSGSARPRP